MITNDELRTARELLDLKQGELAEKLGVSQRTIVNWERDGVPERAETKVLREMGTALAHIRHNKEYDTFLETPEGQQHLEERRQAAERMAEVRSSRPGSYVHSHPESEILRVAMMLEQVSSVELLHELLRRAYDPNNERLPLLLQLYNLTPRTSDAKAATDGVG